MLQLPRYTILLLGVLLAVCLVPSCQTAQPQPSELQEMTRYEKFISDGLYPKIMDIYLDEELLAKANKKCPIYICLSQQRGRLYVDNQVAADWPVSTGIPGRDTPTGKFRITQKKEQYASNRYGKMYDAEGKCINSDADAFTMQVPEGGKFVGSPMPNWMRLTGDGVGMHTGKVRAGQRLSHGCIRTPHRMAMKLFAITDIGTRVTVCDEPEKNYPTNERLDRRIYENRVFNTSNKSQGAVYKAYKATHQS